MNEKGSVVLTNKDELKVSGVNKINSLDPKHFNLDTTLGTLIVTGINLEMSQLDPVNKTIIIKGEIETITYKKEITTKTVVKNYLENTDDILARIIQHPTVTNAKITDDYVQVDITFEIIAEIIGETKMKVTVFKETENWEEEIDTLDMDINENFIG